MVNLRVVGFLALIAACAGATTSSVAATAQTKSCIHRARSLAGAERATFIRKCSRGALAPMRPTAPIAGGPNSQAITKPSGVDRTVRSAQCSAEADRRGLRDNERADFRLSCLATAGPVSESQSQTIHPAKAPAKPVIGEVTGATPHP